MNYTHIGFVKKKFICLTVTIILQYNMFMNNIMIVYYIKRNIFLAVLG